MSYTHDDLVHDIEQQFKDARGNAAQKKKLRELMTKYGNSREEIEAKSTMGEWMEFILANGNELLDEVRREKFAEEARGKAYNIKARMEAKSREQIEDEKAQDLKEDSAAEIKKPSTAPLSALNGDIISAEINNIFSDEELMKREKLFDENVFLKTMKPVIKEHEGIVLHPYVDTADKVTVGPGINVEANAEGVEWCLLDRKTNKLRKLDLSNEEDKAIFDKEMAKLNEYKKGNQKAAGFFEGKTDLRITVENADALYRSRVQGAIKDINDIIKDFNKNLGKKEGYIEPFEKLPQNIQIVLIDMVYNLGKKGFNWEKDPANPKKGFPGFWKGLAHRNVAEMVKECGRVDKKKPLVKRNEAIFKHCLKAFSFATSALLPKSTFFSLFIGICFKQAS